MPSLMSLSLRPCPAEPRVRAAVTLPAQSQRAGFQTRLCNPRRSAEWPSGHRGSLALTPAAVGALPDW